MGSQLGAGVEVLAEPLWSRLQEETLPTKGVEGALWLACAAGWIELEMKLKDLLLGFGHVVIPWV